ncbi:YlbG family protein [Latilactobacillus graminis]|uniref:UPF0298 protein FC90_GL001362 n=2 Tax=Latilactobacillus graminis TaxID=60519 RepID=A0AA89I2S4_9LACO|nr:YlbG family protein [Latilactobacillus graminis]KRM23842.1 hypothetical protein FC90_GL001362 [Latilactobacillus graminis DSM 20719]QFP79732.1 DUF2129 domain-containing protein [Latilactobacillus graminis]
MTLEITQRQGIVVWLYSLRQVKQLRRYGLVYYTSKRMKYVYLYVDMVDTEVVVERLKKLHYVKRVTLSERPTIDMNFNNRVGRLDQEITEAAKMEE